MLASNLDGDSSREPYEDLLVRGADIHDRINTTYLGSRLWMFSPF